MIINYWYNFGRSEFHRCVEEAEKWNAHRYHHRNHVWVSCHAFLPNWLFGCKLLFSPSILFRGGADASLSPLVSTRTRLAFSFTQQEPSGGSFDGKNSHWRSWGGLIGLHLCIGTIMLHSRLLMRNEWGGKPMCGGRTAKANVLHVPSVVCMHECQHGGTL